MKKKTITHLFLDIGDVLLNNGWDHNARKRAAATFNLKLTDTEKRHRLVFNAYTDGKISLEEYLSRVIFYQKRSFTLTHFKRFMFTQSKPDLKMIKLMYHLKAIYGLKIAVVSNEGRELNDYQIRKFKINDFVDSFISSCYIHVHKPDKEIYRLALDITQADPQQVVYIENTPLFVQIAEDLGIRSILHTDYKSTLAKLASLGLKDTDGGIHETK